MTHTKGKWEVIEKANDRNDIAIAARIRNNDGSIAAQNGICIVPSDVGEATHEIKSNAKLIAAAPELLEACMKIRDWYERNHEKYFGTETPVCFSEVLSVIQEAQ